MTIELQNFYPRPPRGGRRAKPLSIKGWKYFYPRPPRGGRHACALLLMTVSKFLSTPSARRATRTQQIIGGILLISIHALREEGDNRVARGQGGYKRFLSTPSARRATLLAPGYLSTSSNFYPRPPRGGRPPAYCEQTSFCYFYPRPPRGGRHKVIDFGFTNKEFLSTPSARRATVRVILPPFDNPYFYPRPPRGGRRRWNSWKRSRSKFLSTPSARRATNYLNKSTRPLEISIHALREEGDDDPLKVKSIKPSISIHALREEGDKIPPVLQ